MDSMWMIDMDIDIVVPWVDSSDPEWIEEFNKFCPSALQKSDRQDASEERYRDMGLLRFWFRGVEKFLPWIRKIHFITNGQKPEWFNLSAEKLHWVRHEDYIPNEFLPVFSSHPIEIFIHRIEGLAEHFIYFNDDFFITQKLSDNFFFRDGSPCDSAIFRSLYPTDSLMTKIRYNDIMVINRFFSKKEQQKKNFRRYFTPKYGTKLLNNLLMSSANHFTAFHDPHTAQPYTKSLFEEVWRNCGDILMEAASHRFRSPDDVNQWLFRYWYLAKGEFHPVNNLKKSRYFDISDDIDTICNAISSKKYAQIILNDDTVKNPEYVFARLRDAFQSILPEKSSFEI